MVERAVHIGEVVGPIPTGRTMFRLIIANYIFGLIAGYLLEFIYRSLQSKIIVKPLFINFQMYGLAAVSIYFIYLLNAPILLKVFFILVVTTGAELFLGYFYLKFKNIRLWNYSNERLNFKGLICPRFSFYWFIASMAYYYLIVPILIDKFI